MTSPTFFAACLLIFLVGEASSQSAIVYDHCTVLNIKNDFRLYWTFPDSTHIAMKISANVRGYVSLGIYPGTTMHPNGSPMIDLWLVSHTTTAGTICTGGCVLDTYMTSTNTMRDTTDSLTNKFVVKNSTFLQGEWIRLLNTGDTRDRQITLAATQLVWAWANTAVTQSTTTSVDTPTHPLSDPTSRGITTIDFGRASTCDAQTTPGVWSNPAGNFRLNYNIDVVAQTITFTMAADTTSWFGFGWSNAAGAAHTTAVYYVGQVTGTNTVTLLQTWANGGLSTPALVTSTFTALSGTNVAGTQTITFTRNFLNGGQQDQAVTNAPAFLSWAVGGGSISGSSYAKHSMAGMGVINFMNSNGSSSTLPPGASTITDTGVDTVPTDAPAALVDSSIVVGGLPLGGLIAIIVVAILCVFFTILVVLSVMRLRSIRRKAAAARVALTQ